VGKHTTFPRKVEQEIYLLELEGLVLWTGRDLMALPVNMFNGSGVLEV
jgi:hypothetical protein